METDRKYNPVRSQTLATCTSNLGPTELQTSNERDGRHEKTSRKSIDQNREEQGRLVEMNCVKSDSTSAGVKSEVKYRRKSIHNIN